MIEFTVTDKDTAKTFRSGDLDVLATPRMIALMEETCKELSNEFLNDGETTVGTAINVSHLSATPVSMKVRCEASITARDNRKLSFHVECFDEAGKIGEGTHERFIVNSEKFINKTNSKIGG